VPAFKFTGSCILVAGCICISQSSMEILLRVELSSSEVCTHMVSGHSFSEPDVIKDKLEPGVWYVTIQCIQYNCIKMYIKDAKKQNSGMDRSISGLDKTKTKQTILTVEACTVIYCI